MYATVPTRFHTLIVERAASVVFLTLDRPDARNAMNLQMVQELRDFFASIRDDRSIRCVVLRGAGETFCAGADIKEMRDPANQTPGAQRGYAVALDAMLLAVQGAPQVTIAAVEGAAMGGGFGLVCVTDIAIADEAAMFAMPEARLGIAPAVISAYVVERIGLTRARPLALTGRRLNGHAAQEIGLVHDVAAAGEMDRVVTEYIRDILKAAPGALAATKTLLACVAGRPPAESRAYRIETLNRLRSGDEAREGMAAFAEKRPPSWAIEEEGSHFR